MNKNTKQYQFEEELLQRMREGQTAKEISDWAFNFYVEECMDISAEFSYFVLSVGAMGEGPEFEDTIDEIEEQINSRRNSQTL